MAYTNKRTFAIKDFRQGITDDSFDNDLGLSYTLDNFDIQPDGTIITRDGSVVEDTTNPQVPNGVSRINGILNYDNSSSLLYIAEDNLYFRNPSAFSEIVGPTSNELFSLTSDDNNIAFSEWNKQIFITHEGFPRPMKIYKDSGGTFRVRTSGLPALASAPSATPSNAGANSYIYAFFYRYTYTVGSQTFEDVGPITQVAVTNSDAPNTNQIDIASIPVLANSTTDNWDTSNITIEIYRTINAGTTFYKVSQVTNGTTTYADTTSDATLQTAVTIYTTDETVEYDPAPLHKYIHIVNNIAYYGFIKDGSVEYPFRVRQSIPGNPSASPATFFIDLEDTVKGIGSVNSIPIVFCNRAVYRLENNFDQFGRNGIRPVRISDTAGCVSHLSIVAAEGYIFWAGNDGFYASDGYKVQKISDKLNVNYSLILTEMSDLGRIQGIFEEKNRRVFWTLQSNSSNADNDTIYILDLKFGVRSHSTFSTRSGATYRPSFMTYFNRKVYYGDNSGYVYYHDDSTKTDPKTDTTIAAANWERETIIWTYESLNYDFGDPVFRKMAIDMILTARNISNTSIQITAINDDGRLERLLKIIRWRKNFTWGDDEFVWGDADCSWRSLGILHQKRAFKAPGLRHSYLRLKISNAYSLITTSDNLSTATFNNITNRATLNDASFSWPENSVDYFISTAADGYVREFKVSSRVSDTVIEVLDPADVFPTGSLAWRLYGYKKGEPLNLIQYSINYNTSDTKQDTFETGDDGT